MGFTMTGEEYLQRLQQREYERLGTEPRHMATVLSDYPDRLAQALIRRQRPKSPLEESLPISQARRFMESLVGIKTPTIFENPVAYSIMAGLAVDIEKSAERIFGSKYKNRPTMGTLPLGAANASAIHVPFTDQFVIVFQENLFPFINLLAKVVAAAIPADGSVEPAEFFYALDGIDAKIATNSVISERFSELLISYLFEGRPHANGQYILVQPYRSYTEILIQAAELYVLGHEHAHIIKGHLPLNGLAEALSEPEIAFSWAQEFEADEVAAMLAINAIGNRRYDITFGYLGADFFCSAMVILSEAVSLFTSKRVGKHPPWLERREHLRESLTNGMGPENAKLSITVAKSIQHILTSLWSTARQTLIQSQLAGAELSPIWTGRSKGYLQNFRSF
jgi:hypothetical protein